MLARPTFKGTTYFVTRRCSERRFFLLPVRFVEKALLYLLLEAVAMFGMQVHAFVALSNHIHYVITDPNGCLPEFMERFHGLVAKVLNVHWGRQESLWANEQAVVIELGDAEAVLDKLVYTLANPVTSGLVERCGHWPGANTLAKTLNGAPMEQHIPRGAERSFFGGETTMPKVVRGRMTIPPAYRQLSQEQWADMVAGRIAALEERLREERAGAGKRVVGVAAVLAQSPSAAPATYAPRGGLRPRLACKNKWRRIALLQRNRAWLEEYKAAWIVWSMGGDPLFPPGTYKLHRHYGARVTPRAGELRC